MKKSELAEIRTMWEREVDDYLLKAATADLNTYSEEVQQIIITEAQKRKLLDSNGRLIDKILGRCKNHPEVQAADRCTDCMEIFCSECLNIIGDEKYCNSCNSKIFRNESVSACKEASDSFKYAVIGLFIIGIVLEPIAIYKALKAKEVINANPGLSGSRKATAAMIIAVIYLLGVTILSSLLYLYRYTAIKG